MPIKTIEGYDPQNDSIETIREKLSTFLSKGELARTQILTVDGQINFKTDIVTLNKINDHLGNCTEA